MDKTLNVTTFFAVTNQVNHLANKLKNQAESLERKTIVICEDKFTLTLESKLSESNGFGSFSVDVFTFDRLLVHLCKNRKTKPHLSKIGSVGLIANILIKYGDKLTCFKSFSSKREEVAKTIYEVIAQLKSSNVAPCDLSPSSTSGLLKSKLSDIKLIYEKYEEEKTALLDASDRFDIICELIEANDDLLDTDIYLIGFDKLTNQFCKLLSTLTKRSKSVEFYSTDSEILGVSPHKQLEDMSLKAGIRLKISRPNEFLTPEQQRLIKIFSYKKLDKVVSDKVDIFLAKDLESELRHICEIISMQVKSGQKHYGDFAVAIDTTTNKELIEEVFAYYKIPVFTGANYKLSEMPFIKYMYSLNKLLEDNFLLSDILVAIKNPYFEFDQSLKEHFENYLLKYTLEHKRFTCHTFAKDKELLPLKEELVKQVNFFSSTVGKFDDIANNIIALSNYLTNITETLSTTLTQKGYYFGEVLRQTHGKLQATLSQLSLVLSYSYFTQSEAMTILEEALSAAEISVPPIFSRTVTIADLGNFKMTEIDTLFVPNANSGNVPKVKLDLGLLSDKDIDALKNLDINPKIALVNAREKAALIQTLLVAKSKLVFSYNIGSGRDDSACSIIIDRLSDAFKTASSEIVATPITQAIPFEDTSSISNVINISDAKSLFSYAVNKFHSSILSNKQSDELTMFVSSLYNELNKFGEKSFCDKILNPDIQKEIAGLIDKKNNFSVSNLESYFACPMQNFLKNVLYLREREEGKTNFDAGNFIHVGLEYFFKDSTINSENFEQKSDEIIASLNDREEFKRLLDAEEIGGEMHRISSELRRVFKTALEFNAVSEFKSFRAEAEFGISSEFPPYKITDNEYISGKIDRIDMYNDYIRIIDYKTGSIDTSYETLYTGEKIQSYVYLAAMCEILNKNPAGALYLPIKETFVDKENVQSRYKMDGCVLADDEILLKMDNTLNVDRGKSNVIPVSFNKLIGGKPQISKIGSNTLSPNEMQDFLSYSKKVAQTALAELKDGNIEASPTKTSCAFCNFSAICKRNEKDKLRAVGSVSKETILNAVKNDTAKNSGNDKEQL